MSPTSSKIFQYFSLPQTVKTVLLLKAASIKGELNFNTRKQKGVNLWEKNDPSGEHHNLKDATLRAGLVSCIIAGPIE